MRKTAQREELPRGIRRRGNSLVVSFALADGTIERKSLGMVSTAFAEEKLLTFKRQVREGNYQGRRPIRPTTYRVSDLWESYRCDYLNRGGRDVSRLEIAWNRLKMFEAKRVEEVSTDSVNKYIASRRANGMEAGTINRETALLRAMFNHGRRVSPPMVDRVPAFPARLKENAPRKGFIGNKEYAVLAANAKDLWMRCLIAVSYSFGFRKGEMLNLRRRQVDLVSRWVELEEGTTKNGEGRKIRMTSEVFELMKACVHDKKPDESVFTRDDGSPVGDPRSAWYSLCVSSGLGKFEQGTRKNGEKYDRYVGLTLHDFRRSAIRNMIRRGISEKVAMKISGHKTRSTLDRYNITDDSDLVEATRRIEAGSEAPISALESDTETDTATYAHS